MRLSNREIRALNRIGDVMVPGDDELPAFSETGCAVHAGELLAFAPPEDVGQLRLLLRILSFMPGFVLRFLVRKMERQDGLPDFLAVLFRQLDFAFRGIVFSLYYSEKVSETYSGKTPLEQIGYRIQRVPKA